MKNSYFAAFLWLMITFISTTLFSNNNENAKDFEQAFVLTVPEYVYGAYAVTGSFRNTFDAPINAFDLHWHIDDGPLNTVSFADLELLQNDSFCFEELVDVDLLPGNYTLTVSITNVLTDGRPLHVDIPEVTSQLRVAHDEVPRRPLFEMFTSSTCPPCATFNNGFFNNFTTENADELSLIKYQMNWPGAGDPYYTPEGGARRSLYGVNSVPWLILDGSRVATSAAAVNSAFSNALQNPAHMEISGHYQIDGYDISIQGSLMAFADFPIVRMQVAVIESVTYNNTGGNGETEFHHVMHKMLPSAFGTILNLEAMEEYQFSFTYNMQDTNVEDMDDLMVVVFTQNQSTREIFQSNYMVLGSQVAFNFNNHQQDVDINAGFEAHYIEPVTFLDGTEITNENVSDLIDFYVADDAKATVPFTALINEDKNEILIDPIDPLDFNTTYVIEIETVLGESGLEADGNSLVFTTRETYGTPEITFNLADGAEEVELDYVFVITANQLVRHADGTDITEATLPGLIHFSVEDAAGELIPFTASINEEHTEFTVIPDDHLDFETIYYLEVDALMGIDGQISEPQAINFTTLTEPVSVPEYSETNIHIYPNPVTDVLVVQTDGLSGNGVINIYNLAGQLMQTTNIQHERVHVDVSGLKNGVYFIELVIDDDKSVRRFTKTY